MSDTTLTLTKPTERGWYWFLPNGKSPKSMTSRTAVQVLVREWVLSVPEDECSDLCAIFPNSTHRVSEMGGLWSERLEEPE